MRFARLLVCVLAMATGAAFAAEKSIKLSSLDWPPYTGPSLADKGATAAVVKAAFEAAGYKVQIDFFPWERAVAMAKDANSGYAGYFPEYFSADNEKDFLYSAPIGNGPLGLAQNTTAPITFGSIDDLSKIKIGVVQGYLNTEEFDKRVAAGQIKTEEVVSDVQNVKKLEAKRIPAAVIDANVLQYLLKTEAASAKGKVDMHSTVLEDKKLFICFRKGPQGDEYAKALAEGLKKIDVNAIMSAHLK